MSYKTIFTYAFMCFLSQVFCGIIKEDDLKLFSVSREDVTFRLWTRDEKVFRPLFYGHLDTEDSIKADKAFKVIVHGWTDSADKGWYDDIKDAYLEKEDCNVIGIDWSSPASSLYPLSVKYTKDVAVFVGELIVDLHDTLDVKFEDVHLIGHSLGAHISGYAGKYVQKNRKGKIGRITGLDPAGPLFTWSGNADRLSVEDAYFVDVIHTDGGKWGLDKAIGHVDFYPNGGSAPQPGCYLFGIVETASCSHTRSYNLFSESINSMGFQARECDSFKNYKEGHCDDNNALVMGDNTIVNGTGKYYLLTNGLPPFAMN